MKSFKLMFQTCIDFNIYWKCPVVISAHSFKSPSTDSSKAVEAALSACIETHSLS